ncbi:tetratricopeptide repeat protein [Streptomyces sviceus]|uniref:tetratricopeptide repeat protein n=1 Tax=Streptomyces sviceus TaxID=285530 RepID=UPI0036A7770B
MTNLITATWNWWLFCSLLVLVTLAAVGTALVPGTVHAANDPSAVNSGGPNTLPPGRAVFAGRDSELDRLRTAEPPTPAARPLVCLITGRSGSGKTELAVQAGHRLAERYPAGQLFVGYRSHAESAGRLRPHDALAAVLATVGAAPASTNFDLESMSSQWRSAVGDKPFLIILDDLAEAAQAQPLLPASARSMVIITSRRVLPGLDADVHVEVDALSEAAARSVVSDILRRGSCTVDDTVIDAVVALHRLPLTIRHIADRIVADRTPVSLGASPPLATREEGLEPMLATIRSLAPTDHLVFRRMGLHPGPHVTAEIAAALAGLSVPDAAGALSRLHRHGLALRPDPYGYGFHDLVRSLAEREGTLRDAPEARTQARERLFRLVARQLARVNTGLHAPLVIDLPEAGGQESQMTMSEREATEWVQHYFDDLRSVTRLAIDSGWSQSWHLTAGMAYLMRIRRNIPQAEELNDSALQITLVSGDEAGRAHCEGQLGALHRASGRHRTALRHAQAAADAFDRLGDRRNQAYCASEVAMNLYHLADYTSARSSMERAVGLHRREAQWRGEANGLGILGMISRATGDYPEARDRLAQALRIYGEKGNHRNEAWILIELGVIDRLTGDLDSAEARFTTALGIYAEASDRNGCAWARREIGIVKRILGQYTEAQTLLEEALREFTDMVGERNTADVHVELCTLHRVAGDLTTARRHGETALQMYRRMENLRGAAWAEVELGVLDREEGRWRSAVERFASGRETYARIGDRSGTARVLLELGRLALLEGEGSAATQYLEGALSHYTDLGAAQAEEVRDLLGG